MALTDQEIDSLRIHLGYPTLIEDGPYTVDSFLAVFEGVISPNLSVGDETSSTTAVTAGSITTVTPVAMTGIAVNVRLVIDNADDAEVVTVKAVTSSTFTARFAKDHASSGYPIATLRGLGQLRLLLHEADRAWSNLSNADTADMAGLQSVDKNDVVWFGNGTGQWQALKHRLQHYRAIVTKISDLIGVRYRWSFGNSSPVTLEAY